MWQWFSRLTTMPWASTRVSRCALPFWTSTNQSSNQVLFHPSDMYYQQRRRQDLHHTIGIHILAFVALLAMTQSFTHALLSKQAPAYRISTRMLSVSEISSNRETSMDSSTMHRVQWTTSEGTKEFDAFDGETLRTAALRRGVVSPHNGRSKLINCR